MDETVSKWFGKQLSSFAFSLQKTYEKLLTSKPSWFVVATVTVVVSLFLLAGGVYDMIIHPIVAYFHQSGTMVVFYWSLTEQFLLESILVMVFYGLGFAGFIISYHSTKHAYNPRNAYRFLLVGCVLLIIGIILMENGLNTKFGL